MTTVTTPRSTAGNPAVPAGGTRTTSNSSPRRLSSWMTLVGLSVALVWTLVPLRWMALSSFKGEDDVTAETPSVFFTPTWENYGKLFGGDAGLTLNIVNSVITTVGSTILSVALGTLAGYGLARTKMRRKADLSFWIISVRMAPIAAVILPLFLMFRYFGLINTLPGLILAYMTFNLPFAIWMMSAFFDRIPPALEESAYVEGAGPWQTFWRVCLPLVKPGMATTAVLCLIFAWNDYAFATVFAGPETKTLTIAASQLVTSTGIDWGRMTAIGTIVVIPMIMVGLAVRRWLVTGLTLGAVTGE